LMRQPGALITNIPIQLWPHRSRWLKQKCRCLLPFNSFGK
jgi:hypothetical protein